MSAIDFAIAYRRYLERDGRHESEPPEPNPADYGMPPTRTAGVVIEDTIAEGLRREVFADFSRDVIAKAKCLRRDVYAACADKIAKEKARNP